HLWSRIAAHLRADNIRAQRVERHPRVWRLSRRAAIAASALFAIGLVFAGRRLMTTDIDAAALMRTPVDELRSFIDSGRSVDVATTDPAQLRQWFVPRVDFAPPDAADNERPVVSRGAALLLLPAPHRRLHVSCRRSCLVALHHVRSGHRISVPTRRDAWWAAGGGSRA